MSAEKKQKRRCVARTSMRWGSQVCLKPIAAKSNSDLCSECAKALAPNQLIDGVLYIGSKDDDT